jgi:BirA family transcriptional regulator, biotin operon repressor / biotin---[acetyl-CoA-carboxylase] ligase
MNRHSIDTLSPRAQSVHDALGRPERFFFHHQKAMPSTHAYLCDAVRQDAQSVFSSALCVADMQTAGQGQRGQIWSSPEGNLYASYACRMQTPLNQLASVSLVVALAVREAMQFYVEDDVALKWPNDVFIQEKKCAGVLCEAVRHDAAWVDVVLSFGVNIKQTGTLPDATQHPQTRTALEAHSREPVLRDALLSLILKRLKHSMTLFEAHGFAYFHDEWKTHDAFLGAPLYAWDDALRRFGACLGVYEGVDAMGFPLVRSESGSLSRAVGSVRLRLFS